MAKQTINIGSAANDGTGDPARTAFGKANDNFTELYDADAILGRYEDFDANRGGCTTPFGGAITDDFANSRIAVATSGTTHGVAFGAPTPGYVEGERYVLLVNITKGTQNLQFRTKWSGIAAGQKTYLLRASGTFAFDFTAPASCAPLITAETTTSDTHYINWFRIYRIPVGLRAAIDGAIGRRFDSGEGAEPPNDAMVAGYGASAGVQGIALGINASAERGIAIGLSAKSSSGGGDTGYTSAAVSYDVCVGHFASTLVNTTIHSSAAGGPKTAIGSNAEAHSWRAVAVGSNAIAAGTSSVAIGPGVLAPGSHHVVIGRNASLPNINDAQYNNGVCIGGPNAGPIWFNCSWGHAADSGPTGMTGFSFTPSTVEIRFSGQDAFDARATPSSFNVSAGHLGFYSGRGTGTGDGGEVRFYTAPAAGAGQNVKNTAVMAAKFDSAAGLTGNKTRFLLLDTTSGTYRRVEFGAADSGGAGFRMLRVPNT